LLLCYVAHLLVGFCSSEYIQVLSELGVLLLTITRCQPRSAFRPGSLRPPALDVSIRR
jgi:hypothetical protein